MAEETITLKIVAQDLASGNISKAIGGIDKMAQRGGIVGSVFQGVGQSFGQMLNPMALMSRGFDIVTDVMGSALRAAQEEEASIAKMTTAIEANAEGWDGNIAAIERVISSRERLAFADDEQRDSLAKLVSVTKDVTEAMDLQAVAMDLARLRGMDLSTAGDLVGKVYAGNLGILSRYGIVLKKGTTATEALAEIQKRASGQAAAYADTTEGKLVAAQIQLDNAMEDLGKTLTPLVAQFAEFASKTIPSVVKALDDLYDDSIGPLIDAIDLSDKTWEAWKDKIRVAGTEAGMTSDDIQNLTDSLKVSYDATLEHTDGMDENARQLGVNKVLTDLLTQSLSGYTSGIDAAADATEVTTKEIYRSWSWTTTEVGRLVGQWPGTIKETIESGKETVRQAMADLRWAMERPFAEEEFAAWLKARADRAMEQLAKAIAQGRPAAIAEAAATRILILEQLNIADPGAGTQEALRQRGQEQGIYRHRAGGGPVFVGQSYIVGERGPELVTMRGNGYVTPNDALGGDFIYAPMFSTASPAEAQRFAQTITPFIERERRRIA